jgi:hypothetical protein
MPNGCGGSAAALAIRMELQGRPTMTIAAALAKGMAS